MATDRIADRKFRDKQNRRIQIIRTAREIAEREGWPSVTVRRLSEQIAYSQPVLYSHFESREAILAAVAVEGFQEMGLALENARMRAKPGKVGEAVAAAYLRFAEDSPAIYEAMFSLNVNLRFDDPATPAELRFAFSQLSKTFEGRCAKPEVVAELFWAQLHGLAELTRTGRLPRNRQKERMTKVVELFDLNAEKMR